MFAHLQHFEKRHSLPKDDFRKTNRQHDSALIQMVRLNEVRMNFTVYHISWCINPLFDYFLRSQVQSLNKSLVFVQGVIRRVIIKSSGRHAQILSWKGHRTKE